MMASFLSHICVTQSQWVKMKPRRYQWSTFSKDLVNNCYGDEFIFSFVYRNNLATIFINACMFLVKISIALQLFRQITNIYSFGYVKYKIESNQGSTNGMNILPSSRTRNDNFSRALIKQRSTSVLKLENYLIFRFLLILYHVILEYMYVFMLNKKRMVILYRSSLELEVINNIYFA